jgi:hypothetical protein
MEQRASWEANSRSASQELHELSPYSRNLFFENLKSI